jgi:hypothetical protein
MSSRGFGSSPFEEIEWALRPIEITESEDRRYGRYTYQVPERPAARARVEVEHNREKRVFIVTDPGGKPAYFRDQPARFLVVEPDDDDDAEPGAMKPVLKHGEPTVLYLCREEWEGRLGSG